MDGTFVTATNIKDKKRDDKTLEPLKDRFNQKSNLQLVQPQAESSEEIKERQWKKTLERITFTPDREDYYANHVVKPGFYFYKALALSTVPIEKLTVNIPETYIGLENTYYIYPENGHMNKVSDISYQEFEQNLEKKYMYYSKLPDLPFIISRVPAATDYQCSKLVYTFNALKENRIYTAENNSMYQRFILPKKEQPAMIMRLVYYTGNSRENKANYAFKIKNNLIISDDDPKITLIHKSTLNADKPYSFRVDELKGNSLREYEKMSNQVVHYLERSYNVRITKVVFDFMTDFGKKTWLFNMKAIELENVAPIIPSLEEGGDKKSLDSLTCSVYCKLCGQIFKKDDASKTLTYKLLWELIQHLKKRGIFLKDITISHNSTRPCRVCDLCYMLAVSEHELIDVEQKFARAQKIPIADALVRVPTDLKPTHRPALLNEKLYQWRLLVFMHSVNNLELDNAYFDPKNIQLHYKFFNQKSVFKMFYVPPYDDTKKPGSPDMGFQSTGMRSGSPTSSRVQKMLEPRGEITFPKKKKASGLYALNSMRVHYFFSETMDIQKFCDDTELCMRIVRGNDWNNFFAEGKTTSIKYFKRNWEKGQTHQAQTLCFFENGRYCTVKSIFGLVCDGMINTELMNLYKHNGIYLPDENFYNSNPFPIEWMEIFEKKDVLIEEVFEDKNAEKIYSPKCSPGDIAKMVELPGARTTGKLNEVESVVKRSWSANRMNNSKALTGQTGDKTSTLHPFKFTTLTESTKTINKPRIYSANAATVKKISSNPQMKTNEEYGGNKTTGFPKRPAEGAEENIDNEIEILSFLTKRPQSHMNPREAKAAQSQVAYLQHFEKQLKVFEDNDLIKKYADDETSREDSKFEDSRKPSARRDYNEEESSHHYRPGGYEQPKKVVEASQADEEEDTQQAKHITHQEFASMIDSMKNKAMETI